jgi:serine phosphatase RsbU (regulator of sigma subunit)
MRNLFRISGFENKLLIFFLLLSVTPTVLISIFGIQYFLGPVERVSSPALRESFSNSMEIARQLSLRVDHDAETASLRLADEYIRSGFPTERRTLDGFLRAAVGRINADFAAFYVLEGEAWRLVTSHPAGIERLDPVIDGRRLSSQHGPQEIPLSDPDVVASGVLNGTESLLVTGLMLEPGMMDKMRKTGDDLSLYGSARRWVSTMRLYIILIFSGIVVVAAISSTILSRVLARRISHPIRELALATERIAKGDLEHRVTVKAKDEIQSLVSSFNNMTQELQESKRNLVAMAKREAQVARDFEIARKVQQDLFPKHLPEEGGWDFAAICRPARAVGGDYYDIFEVAPGRVIFAQGDVSGKGLGASLVMASVHAVIRSWAGSLQHDLAKLVRELNIYLMESSSPETFVTLFLGLLDCDSGRLWYLNCGHPPVLVHCCSDGRLAELTTGGPILGILPGDTYETGDYSLGERDSLILVSDGVTEATNPRGDMLEAEGLLAAVKDCGPDRKAVEIMDGILEAVDKFAQGSEQADDISVLVLRRRSRAGNRDRTEQQAV